MRGQINFLEQRSIRQAARVLQEEHTYVMPAQRDRMILVAAQLPNMDLIDISVHAFHASVSELRNKNKYVDIETKVSTRTYTVIRTGSA